MDDLVAQLRDVSLPPAPPEASLLPLVLVAVPVVAAIGGLTLVLLSLRAGWRGEALKQLEGIRHLDDGQALVEGARLLRRVAMLKQGADVGRLTGEAWLQRLDRLFRTRFFTRGEGRVFGEGLYEAAAQPPPVAELVRLVRRRALLPW